MFFWNPMLLMKLTITFQRQNTIIDTKLAVATQSATEHLRLFTTPLVTLYIPPQQILAHLSKTCIQGIGLNTCIHIYSILCLCVGSNFSFYRQYFFTLTANILQFVQSKFTTFSASYLILVQKRSYGYMIKKITQEINVMIFRGLVNKIVQMFT